MRPGKAVPNAVNKKVVVHRRQTILNHEIWQMRQCFVVYKEISHSINCDLLEQAKISGHIIQTAMCSVLTSASVAVVMWMP